MKTTLKQIGMILLVSGFFALIANSVHPRKIPWVQQWSNLVEGKAREQGIQVISLSTVLQTFKSGQAVFIDARSAGEYEEGHIPNAVSVPFHMLDEKFPVLVELLDTQSELVVYCSNRDCDDALLLATELQAMGAEHLSIFIDGYEVWKNYAEYEGDGG